MLQRIEARLQGFFGNLIDYGPNNPDLSFVKVYGVPLQADNSSRRNPITDASTMRLRNGSRSSDSKAEISTGVRTIRQNDFFLLRQGTLSHEQDGVGFRPHIALRVGTRRRRLS